MRVRVEGPCVPEVQVPVLSPPARVHDILPDKPCTPRVPHICAHKENLLIFVNLCARKCGEVPDFRLEPTDPHLAANAL